MFAIFAISGCVTVAPRWEHEFDGVGDIEGDTIRIVQDADTKPSERWIAVRDYDLEGWFLIRCKDLPAKYDKTLTTESNTLSAWFMKTPLIPEESSIDTWSWCLPEESFQSFREDPDNILFRENILPLEGTVRVRGKDNTVHVIQADLKSRDDQDIRFKGAVTRRWHLFRVNFVLI